MWRSRVRVLGLVVATVMLAVAFVLILEVVSREF